jgi:hypothetical protein
VTDRGSFPVDAQWALQGKTLGRDGYRVLACSTGGRDALSLENFTEAIGRFSMGTPETLPNALPQVTISYLQPGPVNHLALAIHRLASDAHPDEQLTASDDDGRPVVATSYYCVRYDPVAERSVSYRDMYETFAKAPLRPVNGSVLSVEMPAAPAAPDPGAINSLAAKAAALLLMGRPVCILGATLQTSMTDRLGFIDTVMSLIPYGFRARMTAATWTRATNQNHRFRLFFSSARRDTKAPDNVVVWGHPEQTTITRDDDIAEWYLQWLRTGQVSQEQLSLLAGITRPRSLANRYEVLEALDEIAFVSGQRRGPRFTLRTETPNPEQKGSENGPGPTGDTTAAARSEVEHLLIDCARYMEMPDTRQLSAAIGRLKIPARRGVGADEWSRCRELIRVHRLFRHNDALGKDEDTLREILLKIAFEPPLSYEDYCLIEDGVGEAGVPDPSLLQLIDKQGAADDRVKAITYRQLPSGDAEKKLSKWFASKELSADRLLHLLALEVKHPRHMRLLCEVTVEYLRKMSKTYDSKDIDRVLREHSYLARKLQASLAGEDQYQLDTLGFFLAVAFPNGLTRDDLYHIMLGTEEMVTLPFLGAVILMLEDADDAALARELYLYYSFEVMPLKTSTRRELEKLILPKLQAVNPSPESPASSPQPEDAALNRKVSAPLPPHDDLRGDPASQLTTGGQVAPTDGQPDGASLSPPEGSGQQSDPGKRWASEPRTSNDGQ